MGIWGMRRVLTLTTAVCAAALLVLGLLPMALPLTMAFGLVAGLATPPVQSAVRTVYPKMVNSRQLTPLFSLDASLQELIWVFAPVVITFVALQAGTTTAMVLIVVILLGGCAWFIMSPEIGRVRIPRSRRRIGKVLAKPPVLLATVVGFLLIGACAAVEAGVVATFGHGGFEAGIVLALFAIGSLTGGLSFGHIPIGSWAMARRLTVVAVGLMLTTISLNVFWIGGTLLLAGIGIAPALAVVFAITSASVKFSDTAEAYGWIGTGQLIGAAAGSAIAGFVIDGAGPTAAYWAAAVFAVFGVTVSVLWVRSFPDLRHGARPHHHVKHPLAHAPVDRSPGTSCDVAPRQTTSTARRAGRTSGSFEPSGDATQHVQQSESVGIRRLRMREHGRLPRYLDLDLVRVDETAERTERAAQQLP